ncbi:LOW QUALITY PROTEIN: protein held out wings-like [Uloborus diversus]|uniref:LOW QUALITY PROTEIN: protein held out wings-like n=1 Tax=Uloborus diversus TaxID=327109 RepID=UPI00240A3955|nr:LOW QUALITY PROTEIN: protein held out wings-like [Uloborus diversus]
MGETVSGSAHNTADYLAQLLKDKKQLAAFPNVFLHLERLLDDEINKVRNNLFQVNGVKKEPMVLPDADGPVVACSEKVYVPVKDHPDYNFVGRILGPRGMTAKQLEQETGCKIMVRGKGSMRDKKKEEQNRGKPNWEHLNDELHVLITVEDSRNRAQVKLQRATEEIRKLLVPVTEGEDELKKRQLMELAIINGTYRDSTGKNNNIYMFLGEPEAATRLLAAPPMALASNPLRTGGTPLGAPLILSSRIPVPSLLNGGAPPPLISPADAGLLYATYGDYQHYAALASPLLAEYPHADATGAVVKQRRNLGLREHPYQRSGSLS